MEVWSRLQDDKEGSVVIFAVQRADTLAKACAKAQGKVQVLLDPGGRTAKRYNALWLPRAYAVDERGKLTYVQSDETSNAQAPLRVAELWLRKR